MEREQHVDRSPRPHHDLRFAAHVGLELGPLAAPAEPVCIQLRGVDVRVAQRFVPDGADLLLVVNHRTTRAELDAWHALAQRLMARLAVWDLSHGRHLDLERVLATGRTLAEHFEGKAMIVLDNEIDAAGGLAHPHAFLDGDQALRAGALGLDIAFVGKGPALRELLVPGASVRALTAAPPRLDDEADVVRALRAVPRTLTVVHRSYWLRRWSRPDARWLARRAQALSRALERALPDQRHVVVHRFAPEVVSHTAWRIRWRVGVLETVRTLDRATGALVHAEVDDPHLHAPDYVHSAGTTVAVLGMLGFREQLERFRWTLAGGGAGEALAAMADSLLVDLANELTIACADSGPPLADAQRALPHLAALVDGLGKATLASAGGHAVVRLLARLSFVARAQVRVLARLPPLRWWLRTPRVDAHVRRLVGETAAAVFGAEASAAVREVRAQARALFRQATVGRWFAGRRAEALRMAREPLASPGLTSHLELLESSTERVLSEAELAAHDEAKTTAAARRQALCAAADAHHAALAVAPTR